MTSGDRYPVQAGTIIPTLRRALAHFTLPRTSLEDQLNPAGYSIAADTDSIRFDVSQLPRGLYYLSIRYESDQPLMGSRLAVVWPTFETTDNVFTFSRRDDREFFGTALLVNGIDALVFYPSRLPCELRIHSASLRLINRFAQHYLYGETFVRWKLFGPRWTWRRLREDCVRALARLVQGGTDDSYATWWKLHGAPDAAELQRQRIEVAGWERQAADGLPLVSIIMPVYRSRMQDLAAAVDSVRDQTYPRWELCICDDASGDGQLDDYLARLEREEARVKLTRYSENRHISAASNSALALAGGEFVAFLDHDDLLEADALYRVVASLRRRPDTDLLYSDEDVVDAAGAALSPNFKPDWNYDLFRSINYVCHFLVIRSSLLQAVGGLREGYEGAQDFDLVLRVTENLDRERIAHIPRVLYHWRAVEGSTAQDTANKPYAGDAGLRALADHIQRRGIPAEAMPSEIPTAYRLRYDLPEPAPRVAIIVPTHNNLRVLRNGIDKLLARTDYPDYEVLVVDNRSDDPDTLAYLEQVAGDQVRVLRYDAPFNFSAINNFAVERCDAEVVLLLNNDTEVCNGDWLREMISLAVRPGVGAVGAKLFHADDRIQHAGVLLGLGLDRVAAHAFKGQPRAEVGMLARDRLLQEYHAVTGACLAVSRDKYLEVGGLDAEHLAIAFNDVDFCLKLEAAGYINLWTPYAQLYHFESYSRGYDFVGANRRRFEVERDYMHSRWEFRLRRDSFYNPNLSREFENFSLAWPPERLD